MQEDKFIPENSIGNQSDIEGLKSRIASLEFQLKEKEVTPEKAEKEALVKNEIQDYLSQLQQVPVSPLPISARDDTNEISQFEPGEQIGALVSLAFEKGLHRAVSVARKLNNPAILDEFHDAIVDHYYDKLIQDNIIKP